MPTVLLRVGRLALRPAVRIGSEARLELGKVLCYKRTILLRDVRYIAASVVEPHCFRLVALGKEDHVRFSAGAVGRKRAIRKAKHGVEIAVLGQNLEDFT